MIRKHNDEVEIIFELTEVSTNCPYARRLTVHMYGTDDCEACINRAREQFNLEQFKWNVISVTGRGLFT